MSHKSVDSWLLIINNADDEKLLFGGTAFADYLPFSRKGSILFTTRNHEFGIRLVKSKNYIIPIKKITRDKALKLLRRNLKGD